MSETRLGGACFDEALTLEMTRQLVALHQTFPSSTTTRVALRQLEAYTNIPSSPMSRWKCMHDSGYHERWLKQGTRLVSRDFRWRKWRPAEMTDLEL